MLHNGNQEVILTGSRLFFHQESKQSLIWALGWSGFGPLDPALQVSKGDTYISSVYNSSQLFVECLLVTFFPFVIVLFCFCFFSNRYYFVDSGEFCVVQFYFSSHIKFLFSVPSGTSYKIRTTQRKLAWPLRKDDAHEFLLRVGKRWEVNWYWRSPFWLIPRMWFIKLYVFYGDDGFSWAYLSLCLCLRVCVRFSALEISLFCFSSKIRSCMMGSKDFSFWITIFLNTCSNPVGFIQKR